MDIILGTFTMLGALVFIWSNFVESDRAQRWLQMIGCFMQFTGWLSRAVIEGSEIGSVFAVIFGALMVMALFIHGKNIHKDLRSFLIDEEAEQLEQARKHKEERLIKDVQKSEERANEYGNNVYD